MANSNLHEILPRILRMTSIRKRGEKFQEYKEEKLLDTFGRNVCQTYYGKILLFSPKNKKNKTERGREGEGRDEGGKVT